MLVQELLDNFFDKIFRCDFQDLQRDEREHMNDDAFINKLKLTLHLRMRVFFIYLNFEVPRGFFLHRSIFNNFDQFTAELVLN